MTYAEKLKDPRWQKKRLNLLNKALWACENCGEEKETLQIHHTFYEYNAEPWDYENNTLVVLCKSCHTDESKNGKCHIENQIDILKRNGFLLSEISEILCNFISRNIGV